MIGGRTQVVVVNHRLKPRPSRSRLLGLRKRVLVWSADSCVISGDGGFVGDVAGMRIRMIG